MSLYRYYRSIQGNRIGQKYTIQGRKKEREKRGRKRGENQSWKQSMSKSESIYLDGV